MKLRKLSKVVLLAVAAVFLLAAFPACSDGSDDGGRAEPRVVEQYGSEADGAQLTFYDDGRFLLEEAGPAAKNARVLSQVSWGTYTSTADGYNLAFTSGPRSGTTATVAKSENSISLKVNGEEIYTLPKSSGNSGADDPPPDESEDSPNSGQNGKGDIFAQYRYEEPYLDKWDAYTFYDNGTYRRDGSIEGKTSYVYGKWKGNLALPTTKITLTWLEMDGNDVSSDEFTEVVDIIGGRLVYDLNYYEKVTNPVDYAPERYTVTFDSDGGSDVQEQKIEKNRKATRPDNPTKDGWMFTGWYEEGADTEFNFTTTAITRNITLTARWEERPAPNTYLTIENGVLKGYIDERFPSDGIAKIPDDVTEIAANAFNNCTKLTGVTIPDSVTTIGASAFSGCTNLTSVIIPGTVTVIADQTFSRCTALKSVTIPEGVTTIGASAFSGCTKLTSVTIPQSVTKINKNAFASCTALTSAIIEGPVTIIEPETFKDCTSLTTVKMPDTMTQIRSSAFEGCEKLENITIPDSVTVIAARAFLGAGLTSVTIPKGVTEILGNVFNGCKISKVDIPAAVKSIGEDAFKSRSLTTVTFHRNYPQKDVDAAFRGCPNLANVTFGDGVTEITPKMFSGAGIKKVTISNTVEAIADQAFMDCKQLTSVTFPASTSLISIGIAAFYGCSNLTDMTIPDSLTSIETAAFYDCSNLTDMTIPDSLIKIGNQAFYGCSKLTSMTIPGNMAIIGAIAFGNCTKLTKVTFVDQNGWQRLVRTGNDEVYIPLEPAATDLNVKTPSTNATNLKNVTANRTNNWGYTGLFNKNKLSEDE